MEGLQSYRWFRGVHKINIQNDANRLESFQSVSPQVSSFRTLFNNILCSTHPQGRHRGEVEDAIHKLDRKLHEAIAHVEDNRRKRELSMDDSVPMGDAKRLKTSNEASEPSTSRVHRPVDPAILANFDFATVPRPVLVDIIVESLKLLSEEQLQAAIEVCLGQDWCHIRIEQIRRNGELLTLRLRWRPSHLPKKLWRILSSKLNPLTRSIWISKRT